MHILDLSLCGITETFSYNNDYERSRNNCCNEKKDSDRKVNDIILPSAWNFRYLNWKELLNERYIMAEVLDRSNGKKGEPLKVTTDLVDIRLWHDLFFRSFGMTDDEDNSGHGQIDQTSRNYCNESIISALEEHGYITVTENGIADIDYEGILQLLNHKASLDSQTNLSQRGKAEKSSLNDTLRWFSNSLTILSNIDTYANYTSANQLVNNLGPRSEFHTRHLQHNEAKVVNMYHNSRSCGELKFLSNTDV